MEVAIIKFLQSLSSGFVVLVNSMLSYFASWVGFVFMLICLFMFTKKKSYAICFGLTYGVSFAVSQIMKIIINRPRPYVVDPSIIDMMHTLDASMPSGHMISASVMAVFLLYLVVKCVKTKWVRVSLYVLIPLVVSLVGVSRMFLGQHFISDVVVGLVVGTGIGVVGLVIYEKWQKARQQKTKTEEVDVHGT